MTELRGGDLEFIDLHSQRHQLGNRIETAIGRVLEHGRFIMGPEVAELETELARFAGVRHAVGCASGTDALMMALMAWDVGPGDGVFVPSFTFAATAEVVALLGATPIFVDVERHTFNICPSSLERTLRSVGGELRPKVVIAVDMFGLPADYDTIEELAEQKGLSVLADCAQSFGASRGGLRAGAMGRIATTSFFPAKPLGCYGDGGAIFTDDAETDSVLRSVRVHGQGSSKYDNVRIGINGRLDTIQAAILLEKLSVFRREINARQSIATRYSSALQDVVQVPGSQGGTTSAWAQYTVVVEARDAVARELKERGIPTAVYYPKGLHEQAAYRRYPTDPEGLPMTEELTREVLSLPMHPYLAEDTQDHIINEVRRAVEMNGA